MRQYSRAPILLSLAFFTCLSFSGVAQQATKRLPIIDVHVHAMKANPNFASDLCP